MYFQCSSGSKYVVCLIETSKRQHTAHLPPDAGARHSSTFACSMQLIRHAARCSKVRSGLLHAARHAGFWLVECFGGLPIAVRWLVECSDSFCTGIIRRTLALQCLRIDLWLTTHCSRPVAALYLYAGLRTSFHAELVWISLVYFNSFYLINYWTIKPYSKQSGKVILVVAARFWGKYFSFSRL